MNKTQKQFKDYNSVLIKDGTCYIMECFLYFLKDRSESKC